MNNLPKYNGKAFKKVGFIGLGRSNLGILSYLKEKYPRLEFTLRCANADVCGSEAFKRIMSGTDELSDIDEDILFLSPSVRRDKRELLKAAERGVILSSDSEFFLENTSSDIYAITGSDGKSTTTTLASRLLACGYSDAVPCGNIGEAMTPHLSDPRGTAYAAELSSFQLMYSRPKSKRCVITNITKNHLDWHRSFEEYIRAKENILENAEERIFNFDCPISRELMKRHGAFAVFSTLEGEKSLRSAVSAELYITLDGGYICISGERILSLSETALGGSHNIQNYMAAIALCFGICKSSDISELARSFTGLSHRCESFLTHHGVKYINSSIDSSPIRTAKTLDMLGENIIVILGGRSKGLDYAELLPALLRHARLAILTGESGEEIEELLKKRGLSLPYLRISDFYGAAKAAYSAATEGDTVLLSPASTSFDSFRNFEERGNAFKDYIKELTKERKLSSESKI